MSSAIMDQRTQSEPLLSVPPSRPGLVTVVLVLTDILAVTLAGSLALWLRVRFVGPLTLQPYLQVLPGLLFFPLAFNLVGIYPGYGLSAVERLRRTVWAVSLVSLFLASSSFLFRGGQEVSRVVFGVGWILALFLMPLAGAAVRYLLSRAVWWGRPVLIMGDARSAEVVVRSLLQNRGLGLYPIGCFDDSAVRRDGHLAGVPILDSSSVVHKIAKLYGVDMAVLVMTTLNRKRILAVLESPDSIFRRVILVPDLFGLHSLWVSVRDLGGILGFEVQRNLLYPRNLWLKRSIDLTLGVLALLLAMPVILLGALAVKLHSPGPAFFRQEREGHGGRRIRVWKIRTMVPHAEAVLERYLASNPEARIEWEQHIKLRHDPRIVPAVGAFLRRFSLDELPQLWNVLAGDMSLVGPRPLPDYHLRRFPEAFRALRCRVPPGITGLWQVSERSEADLERQEQLDTYYIRNWSPWLDLYLLARTVGAVLRGRGAY